MSDTSSPTMSGDPFRFAVGEIGADARRALEGVRTGRILAAFERSFYVETGAGLVCLGAANLYRG
ncbi:MAG: hypothetical protein VW405_10635, partial [Rhodospirillaceae bacterium]